MSNTNFSTVCIGTVKTYSLSKMGKFGTSVKVLPVNVKNGTNTLKCFKVNGTERLPILAQTVLPDLKFYKVCWLDQIEIESDIICVFIILYNIMLFIIVDR